MILINDVLYITGSDAVDEYRLTIDYSEPVLNIDFWLVPSSIIRLTALLAAVYWLADIEIDTAGKRGANGRAGV